MKDHHYSFLCEQLSKCADKWEDIAIGLRFKADEIRNIKHDPMNVNGGHKACLGTILYDWMQWIPGDARGSKERATLEALKTSVSKAGCGVVADELTLSEESNTPLGSGSSPSQNASTNCNDQSPNSG